MAVIAVINEETKQVVGHYGVYDLVKIGEDAPIRNVRRVPSAIRGAHNQVRRAGLDLSKHDVEFRDEVTV